MPLILCAFLLLAVVWVYQFSLFMLLDDQSFPGSHDKLIWGAAFLFFFPVTPFAFMSWKAARISLVSSEHTAAPKAAN